MRYVKEVKNCVDCPHAEWGRGGKWCMEGAGILTEGHGPLPDCPLKGKRMDFDVSNLLYTGVMVLVIVAILIGIVIGLAI